MNKQKFFDECRAAKLVLTKNGLAVLIGGVVFDVQAHEDLSSYFEWLVEALNSTSANDAQKEDAP